jgi:hypothetical protein
VSTTDVTITTGEHALNGMPVSVELNLQHSVNDTPGCLVHDGIEIPAQVERIDEGAARIWFVIDQPAHESRIHRLHIGKECDDGNSFTWERIRDDAVRLALNGRPLLQYEHPVIDPEKIEETKKPYHHVFDPDGRQLITKGLGGLYPHHRGIFFGYNRIQVEDNEYDVWHAVNGEHTEHVEFVQSFSGPVMGGHIVRIEWRGRDGLTFAEEVREIRVYKQPENESLIDFRSTLRSIDGTVILDGDLHHAGVHFRASQDVADHNERSRFMRPVQWADLPEDEEFGADELMDVPWNAFGFSIEDSRYTVAYMSHPGNPSGAEFSERLYGRFGEFFPYVLTPGNPLYIRYRFWVVSGKCVNREEVQERYEVYANPPEVRSGW